MTPLDRAAVQLALALAGAGCHVPRTATLAALATWARDYGPETVAGWVLEDPGWIIAPSAPPNANAFGPTLAAVGRFRG